MIAKICLLLFLASAILCCSSNIESNNFVPGSPQVRALEIFPSSGAVFRRGEAIDLKVVAVMDNGTRLDASRFVVWDTGLAGSGASSAGAIASLTDTGKETFLRTLSEGQFFVKAKLFGVQSTSVFVVRDEMPNLASPVDGLVDAISNLIPSTSFELPIDAEEPLESPDPKQKMEMPVVEAASENSIASYESVELPKEVLEDEKTPTLLIGMPPSEDHDDESEPLSIMSVSVSDDLENDESLFVVEGHGFCSNSKVSINGESCKIFKIVAAKRKHGVQKILCKKKKKHKKSERCQVQVSNSKD